jgi:NADH:ubiquinone oxidoreductase subunit H
MYYYSTLISLIEVVLVLVPVLVGIAYITIAERKTLPSVQIIFDFSLVSILPLFLFEI